MHEAHPARNVLLAFKDGLVKPSLPALSGTVLVCVLAFTVCVFLLTPQFLGRHGLGYLVENADDSYGYLTTQILSMATETELPEAVVLLGASAMRESLSFPLLAAQIQHTGRKKVKLIPMLAEGLTDWEMAAITCTLGSKMRGVVIIEVAPGHFARSLDWIPGLARQPRILFGNGCLDEQLRASGAVVPDRLGNLFLDNYRFFFSRPAALLNLIAGPREVRYNRSQNWRTIRGKALDLGIHQRLAWVQDYRNLRETHLGVFRRMLGALAGDRVSMVLLEAPRNPLCDEVGRRDPVYLEAKALYEKDVLELTSAFGAEYWRLDSRARLSPGDFADSAHLQNRAAIERYTGLLAQEVSRLLKAREER